MRRLFCAVGTIAGISQTWDNEPSLIESVVDGRSPKTNIGMKPTHPLHSLLSGNHTDETDVLCSAFLDTINGGSGCITGCQHRRHDDHEPLRKVGRSFEKIFDCNECIGIAVKPNMRTRAAHEGDESVTDGALHGVLGSTVESDAVNHRADDDAPPQNLF